MIKKKNIVRPTLNRLQILMVGRKKNDKNMKLTNLIFYLKNGNGTGRRILRAILAVVSALLCPQVVRVRSVLKIFVKIVESNLNKNFQINNYIV